MILQVWLVCGGRQFGNLQGVERGTVLWDIRKKQYNFIMRTLDRLAIERSTEYKLDDNWLPFDIKIVSGMATGADTAAADWAVVNWCQLEEFPANWNRHGKAAGFH